jgi:N-acetyl-anhydromuramyl-L-alanine amidase AmpD
MNAKDTHKWIPLVQERDWKYIVIHHTSFPKGNMENIDRMHKKKGWDEVGYHFVIGNGTASANGQIEISPRWIKQKHGAHTRIRPDDDNDVNQYGIGVCLIGDFDINEPTPQQMTSCKKLVEFLMKRYHIGVKNLRGHREFKNTVTCPGKYFIMDAFRNNF